MLKDSIQDTVGKLFITKDSNTYILIVVELQIFTDGKHVHKKYHRRWRIKKSCFEFYSME